eukprot:2235513-Amphidinium_carterae.3
MVPTLGCDAQAQRADLPLASPIAQQIISWMNNTIRKGHASYGLVAGAGRLLRVYPCVVKFMTS